jgi:hypothetical protein
MTEPRQTEPSEQERRRQVADMKGIEWFPLLRGAVPLIAASLSLTVVYVYLGVTSETRVTLLGAPLILLGGVLALLGTRRRLREMRTLEDPTTHGYGSLLLGWALVVVGMLAPIYLLG